MEQNSLQQYETDNLLSLLGTGDTVKLESALLTLLLSETVPKSSLPGILDRVLCHSISHKLLPAVQILINAGVDVSGSLSNTHEKIPPLHVACKTGDTDIVICLLQADAQVNQRDTEGQTPLHIAVRNGDSNIVEVLLTYQVDLNIKNYNGQTAVEVALEQESLHLVTMLLNKLDKKTLCSYQENVDRFACQHGDIAFIERYIPVQLLKSRSPKQMERVNEICHQVCLHKNMKALEYLMNHKVKFGNRHKNTTALHIACGKGSLAIVKLLLSVCTKEVKDHRKRTPIYNAVEKRNTEVVRLLLQNGAKVHVSEENGKTPLHVACALGNAAIIDLLLKYGADTNAQDNGSFTALMIVVARKLNKFSKGASLSVVQQRHVIKALLAHKADINLINNEGYNALHVATDHLNSVAMGMLLSAGADVNTTLKVKNNSPKWEVPPLLSIVIESSYKYSRQHKTKDPVGIEMAKTLIKAGADLNCYESLCAPLIQACVFNSVIAQILLQSGCDIERSAATFTGEKWTPLQFAVHYRAYNIAIELIKRGAKVNILYKNHSTLLHQAIRPLIYKVDIVRALLRSGVDVNALSDNGISVLYWFLRGKERRYRMYPNGGSYDNVGVLCNNIETNSDLEALKAIIESPCVDLDVRDTETGDSLLIAAVKYAPKYRKEIIASFLEQGADGNAANCMGQRALHVAAAKGQLETVTVLAENGCDLNLRDSNSNTPLDIAIMHRSENCGIYLVNKMTDVQCLSDVMLHRSLSLRMQKLSKKLIERGCSVNARVTQSLYSNGFTVLEPYGRLCFNSLSISIVNRDIHSMITVLEAGFSEHQTRDTYRATRAIFMRGTPSVEVHYRRPILSPLSSTEQKDFCLHQIRTDGLMWFVLLSAGTMPDSVVFTKQYVTETPVVVTERMLCGIVSLLCALLELGIHVDWEVLEEVFSDCNFDVLKAKWILPNLEVLAARCVRTHLFPNAWVSAHCLSLPQQLYHEHFGKFFERLTFCRGV